MWGAGGGVGGASGTAPQSGGRQRRHFIRRQVWARCSFQEPAPSRKVNQSCETYGGARKAKNGDDPACRTETQ